MHITTFPFPAVVELLFHAHSVRFLDGREELLACRPAGPAAPTSVNLARLVATIPALAPRPLHTTTPTRGHSSPCSFIFFFGCCPGRSASRFYDLRKRRTVGCYERAHGVAGAGSLRR